MKMKRMRTRVLIAALCIAGLSLGGCSESTPVEGFFLFITNSWEDVADSIHTFLLESNDDGEKEGRFTGTEFVDAFDPQGNPLSGQWGNNSIQFTVERPSGAITFRGALTANGQTQLTFTSPGGALTIRQQ